MSKKKKGRKAKVVALHRKLSPQNYIKKVARKLPIYEVYISDGFLDIGSAIVMVSRRKKNGKIVLGSYQIDSFCLGLVDSHYSILHADEYKIYLEEMNSTGGIRMIEINANYAFNYIYGSIEFGEDNGFAPHKGFHISKYILDDVDDIDYVDIEFGKNGKPLYIMSGSGNHERNLNILDKVVGPENYEIDFEDSLYEDEYEDITIEDYISETLNEEELFHYESYLSGLILIDELYQGREEELLDAYHNNKTEIIDRCTSQLFEPIEYSSEDLDGLFSLWIPIAENYLIHGGYDFLYEEIMIDCFQSFDDDNEEAALFLMNFLLHMSGPQKIKSVLRVLATTLYEVMPEQKVKETLRSFIEKSASDILEFAGDFNVREISLFYYIYCYEQKFGKIEIEDLDLSP